MSLAETPFSAGNELTLADLEAMPDDGHRYELIGGAIVMTPGPSVDHQRLVGELFVLLRAACPDGLAAYLSPIDLDLPGGQRVEPDIVVGVVVARETLRLTLPVLLVVEVVSPGSRRNDLVTKRDTYAEAGIPHYWVFEPLAMDALCLELVDGGYVPYANGRTVTVDRPLPVTFDVAELVAPR